MALKIGLPVIFQPYQRLHPLAVLTAGLNRPIISLLPFGLSRWKYLHFLWRDWEFQTGFQQFAEYGEVFIEARSAGSVLYVANAEVAWQIFMKRNEFPKNLRLYKMVQFFGENVLTTGGTTWRHHRKITSPSFSESVYSAVWSETVLLTQTLLGQWTAAQNKGQLVSKSGIPGIMFRPDMKTVARNVISKSGFGVSLPMISSVISEPETAKQSPQEGRGDKIDVTDDAYFSPDFTPKGHTLPYGEALDHLLENILLLVIVPRAILHRGTAGMKKAAQAYEDVGIYVKELLQRERSSSPSGQQQNLLGALADSSNSEGGLSESETVGNIFIFALAGLETTAGALQYAILLLAIHPEIQDWLHKDIKNVLAQKAACPDPTTWEYNMLYPKLVGCACVINETLRIFPPFQHLPKTTSQTPQPLTFDSKTYQIPAETSISISLTGLGLNPRYWGSSPEKFTPQKWDARDPTSGWYDSDGTPIATDTQPGTQMRQPVKGAWVPFAEGFRSCLGKKFAMVEMVAFLAVVFAEFRVEIERMEGESREMADRRAWGVARSSTAAITVAMRGEIGVRLVRR
ncbi:cytochrome P450 [Wilcoxina mikolae CBS 423.85]|nr:cytochrome P450 [Wilcoxina mikolae CBS 423.85]